MTLDREKFQAITLETVLALRRLADVQVIVIAAPSNGDRPFSAGTLDIDDQIRLLRFIADSFESHAQPREIFSVPVHDPQREKE